MALGILSILNNNIFGQIMTILILTSNTCIQKSQIKTTNSNNLLEK